MNETIFLFKDKSVKTVKKFHKSISKYFDEIKYILFPIDLFTDSFILINPKKYMMKFTKAIVRFESVIIQDSYFTEYYCKDCYSKISETEKEITDVTSLIQYLHSLNRIKFCNKLANSAESIIVERTEFTKFNIEIFSNNDIIYSKYMDIKNQKGQFGAIDILENISDIYDPIKIPYKYSYLEISTKWKYTKNISNNVLSIYGLYLPRTRSFTFFNKTGLSILSYNINQAYFYTATFNPDYIEQEEYSYQCREYNKYIYEMNNATPIRFQDFWAHELSELIEYITYLPYIQSFNITSSEINDHGKPINKYKAISRLEIEFFDREKNIEIECDSDKPFTINNLFEHIAKF